MQTYVLKVRLQPTTLSLENLRAHFAPLHRSSQEISFVELGGKQTIFSIRQFPEIARLSSEFFNKACRPRSTGSTGVLAGRNLPLIRPAPGPFPRAGDRGRRQSLFPRGSAAGGLSSNRRQTAPRASGQTSCAGVHRQTGIPGIPPETHHWDRPNTRARKTSPVPDTVAREYAGNSPRRGSRSRHS